MRITDGAGLSDALLQMPSSSEFTLKQTGKDEISQRQKDGQAVTVMQRHYLLTPMQSGELTVPAKDVKLSAEWSQQKPTFKVGEAVSRTIRLYALGAASEKLPNLDFTEADGAMGALVVAALLYLRHRRAQSPTTVKTGSLHSARARKNHQQALKQLRDRVVDACQSNQPEAVYSAFRAWNAEAYPGKSLNAVNLRANHTEFANEFDALELRLFQSGELQTWQAEKFLNAFRQMAAYTAKSEGRNRMPAHVPALYPT